MESSGFRLIRVHFLLLACVAAGRASADTIPSLNEILNATKLDVRSARRLPTPNDARVLEVRSDAPLRQAFRVGPNVTRLAQIAIWFPGWSQTWTPEKSLILRLYAGEDRSRILAESEEPYSRRLWEGAVHVFTLNTTVEQNRSYAFELTVAGGTSLIGAALASPPFAAGVGPLSRNGVELPGALWFETMVKRRADLDLLYMDVFSHFDLLRPELRAVRAAVAVRDWDRAKAALVAHFESRKDLFTDAREGARLSDARMRATLAQADLAIEHKFEAPDEIVDLGPRWNHLAAWRTRGGVGLTRSGLRGILAAAYTETGDERYARAWDAMLRFQFEDLPSPLRAGVLPKDAPDIPSIGEPGIGGSMWSSLAIGARMSHGFVYYSAFRRSPSFTLDTRFAFLVNLAEMSDVLEKMKGGANWEAQNTTTLLEFGRTFPEFRNAGNWKAHGFAGALESCLENTFPDGPLREATTNYHSLSLNRYLGILESARKHPASRITVPPEVRDRVERMCDYLLYSTMPNGQIPRWGDSNPPSDPSGLLLRGAEYFGRSDMRWVATRGKAGIPPKTTSIAFPRAGYFVMRSGWDAGAAFLALHNGRSSAHGHNDANSFALTARGNELLIDPGAYIYGTPEAQLLTRSAAHNTITMDNRDAANDQGEAHWTTSPTMDVYDGSNAGYEVPRQADRAARHRRIVVFFKPSLFFIVDTAMGEQAHDWTLRYHFAPGRLDVAADGKSLMFHAGRDAGYTGNGKGGLQVSSAAPGDNTYLAVAQGLAAGGSARKIETPVASWTQLRTKEAHWAVLLAPFASTPAHARWDVRQDENGTAIAQQTDANGRRFLLVRSQPEAPFPDAWTNATGISTDAEVACYEESSAPKSRISRRLSLQKGTLLLDMRSESPAVMRAAESVALLEATWQGDTLTVRHQGGTDITLRTFGARRLISNGRSIPIATGQSFCRLPDP